MSLIGATSFGLYRFSFTVEITPEQDLAPLREIIHLLETHGWVEMRSKGSHRHFKHPNQAFVVTVPGNEGKELAPGTLNAILKKAGLK